MKRIAGFFVTGTDTGVGKTEIACGLIRALELAGCSAVGMKPIAAGARRTNGKLRNTDVDRLDAASRVRAPLSLRNPYLFVPPIAPHIASAEAQTPVDLRLLVDRCSQLAQRARAVVVEGAGGFLVPLDADVDMADLAVCLRLPVILVVGMRLGCLSHALLTVEAIERRGLALAGWVANRVDPRMRRYRANVDALRTRIDAPLLADVACVRAPRARQREIAQRLDVTRLAKWLPPLAAT